MNFFIVLYNIIENIIMLSQERFNVFLQVVNDFFDFT